jgi:phage gpG-like protein
MISIIAKGIDKLLVNLKELGNRISNYSPLLNQVGKIELDETRKRILQTKMSPNGTPWLPWAPSTLAHRNKKGNTSKGLLNDTSALLNSFKIIVKDNQVVVGTNLPYAKYLQDGTNKMPTRPFLGLPITSRESVSILIDKYVGLPKGK